MDFIIAHCDGGSRGNPGPAGFGAVIEDERGNSIAKLSQYLGIRTNNYAEYSGLISVLKYAFENSHKKVRVTADSQVMVNQMRQIFKVNSTSLKPLWAEAQALASKLEKFEIVHTLRAGNKDADELANAAMDRGRGADNPESVVTNHVGSQLAKTYVALPVVPPQRDLPAIEDIEGGEFDASLYSEFEYEDHLPTQEQVAVKTPDWKIVEITRFAIQDNQGNTIALATTKEGAEKVRAALAA